MTRALNDAVTAAPPGPVRLHVSVGALAQFVYRSGDLGQGGGAVLAAEGIACQQRYQRQVSMAGYRREVRLAGVFAFEDVALSMAGRADGAFEQDGQPWVEEIKTLRGDVATLRQRQGAVHDAQLWLYAALLAREDGLDAVGLRLTYLDADAPRHGDAVIGQFDEVVSRQRLEAFMATTAQRFGRWMQAEAEWRRARDASLRAAAFPMLEFRPGQRDLAAATWQTVRHGGQLLAQAPTGIGKSMAVLFGALKALPDQGAQRLLWLTPRGSARSAALHAVDALAGSGVRLRTVELLARARMCAVPGTPCNAAACAYAQGYFERRGQALEQLLHDPGADRVVITAERLREVAEGERVCPAQLQRDAARWADLVVGDVAYGFDPFAQQRELMDADEGGAVLLIDEAHNLVERGREMFSAALSVAALRELRAQLKQAGAPWYRRVDGLLRTLLRAADSASESRGQRAVDAAADADAAAFDRAAALGRAAALDRAAVLDGAAAIDGAAALAQRLSTRLSDLVGVALAWQADAAPGPAVSAINDAVDAWLRFIEASDFLAGSAAGVTFWDPDAQALRVVCLAPETRLATPLRQAAATVAFSASLAPLGEYRRRLGLADDCRGLDLPSPFDAQRQCTLLVDDLAMRSACRERSVDALATLLLGLFNAAPGHHLVFAPSFAFSERLALLLKQRCPALLLQCQQRGMSEQDRADFLAGLAHPDGTTRVALAVSGGLFAEGVDLAGDRLIGVTVAGLPVPPPDLVRRRLRDYHDERGEDVAYRIPTMTRVMQAAGRLIRGPQDRGVVCIVDDRLRHGAWRALLPAHWNSERVGHVDVPARVRAFTAQHDAS